MIYELLNYFKVMLVADGTEKSLDFSFMTKGILLNFKPTKAQAIALTNYVRDNNVQTLFTVAEVNTLSTNELLLKQFTHYALSYWSGYTLDIPRETDGSDVATISFIRGVTRAELQELIDDSLYSNRPVKDSKILAGIIKSYDLVYRVNDIRNNELRVLLFDVSKDVFTSGDDAVRYIVNLCSESDLLIKSNEVVQAVQASASRVEERFLRAHANALATVFNRHKRILMAVKVGSRDKGVRSEINKIARWSKTAHKPIVEPLSKSFVRDAVASDLDTYNYKNLKSFSLRDKLKILNLLEFKTHRLDKDVFVIRNGKTHLAEGRTMYYPDRIETAITNILESIKGDLAHLEGKTICLPKDIDYGLPVSRKQSVGHLPFGTKVSTDEIEISSGVYWKNDDGAYDIDLSAITVDGARTGWGSRYGYNRGESGIQFSGDIVSAPHGAMEFLTSSNKTYGVFANIFNGQIGATVEVLVGERSRKSWMDKTAIREKVSLKSRGNLLGFVDGKTFTVFYGRLMSAKVSNPRDAVLFQKGLTMKWTVKKLLDKFGISYTDDRNSDYDLSYEGFTFDKLEKLFNI